MEASQEAATYNDNSAGVSLSNPLLELPESHLPSSSQSFNYYTDPMAAYSGNKQRSKVSPQISQDYSSTPQRPRTNEMLSSPSFQPHINHSTNPRWQQPQGQYANPNYAYTSNASQGGNLPCLSLDSQGRGWNNIRPRPGGYHGPGSVGYPSPQPHFTSGPAHGLGQGGYPSPRFTNSPSQGSGRGYPSPGSGSEPHFRNSMSPGQGAYSRVGPNQSRGQWQANSVSPGPSSGRGRGGWSGGGRGRGGARNHVSAEDRPDLFFNKSMVEDPWKFLEPVIWKSTKKQWLPHSISAKKPKVLESSRQSSPQPSLAEILAASFNAASSDEPSKE